MKLYEHEAKQLLERHGVGTPAADEQNEAVVKAQVLAKNRAEKGGVRFADTPKEAQDIRDRMQNMEIDGESVDSVLVEQQVDIEQEYYISFMYDTDFRAPVMLFSGDGGTGVEGRGADRLVVPEAETWRFREFLNNRVPSSELNPLSSTLVSAAKAFFEEDMRLLEINPLAQTPDGYVAVDALAELEDDASFRHNREFPERSELGREKTKRERAAERIDEDDHRGVAGKYIEMDGDIGMMLAGGGASLTNMDAMMEAGGQPANYTEYGGNPPTEKVYRLSKVIMDRDLNGLWHVGGTANNTDILRTMKGFVQALREEEPEYPIVVRRDGPHADEAFDLLRRVRQELDLRMKLYRNDTPMTQTAEELMEMIEA